MAEIPKVLFQKWKHSHEEDTLEEMVFRPANHPFPPSRGRAGFELLPDGSYLDLRIAPADGIKETRGTWQFLGEDTLALQQAVPGGQKRLLKIASVAPDRLVVKK